MPDGGNRSNAAAQCLSSGVSIQHNQLASQASKTYPANFNCITRIFVIDARYHGDLGDVWIRPLRLECCQQDWLGEAEVHQLHSAASLQQHIAGLHIAMDDALVMGMLQRLSHLARHWRGLPRIEQAASHEVL